MPPPQPNQRQPRRNQQPSSNSVPDRLPPHSAEAEQALLGCILLDPMVTLPACIERIRAESFYDLRHQEIYSTMLELFEENEPVEVPSLFERLSAWGKADTVGGAAYISTLPDATPAATNADYYIGIVRDRWIERQMIRVCTDTVSRIFDRTGNTAELMDQVERDVLRVAESRAENVTRTAVEYVRDAMRNIETAYTSNGELIGIGSGFADIDRMTQGFRGGQMITVAGRPGLGKSSLAANIADHAAVDLGIPTGIFTLEMSGEEYMERMIAARARVNLRDIGQGMLPQEGMDRIIRSSGQLSRAPIHIEDTAGLSILEVRAKARRMHQQHGVRLILIDYLQLMNASGGSRKHESRQQEVSDISNGIKNLARELNVPVIALVQMNRDIERDKGRKPRLSDLRESGSIEQDSDLVGFLFKSRMDEEDAIADEDAAESVNFLIAKQRGGPTGVVRLTFLKQFTKFESAARVQTEEEEEAPRQRQEALPYADR